MKVLAIESSTHRGSVALADGPKILAERFISKNAEQLIPSVEEIMEETATGKSEIGLIAVSSGPGYFTSLKVGAAAAKCFSYALNIPIAPVSSLEIVASGADIPPQSVVCSAIDARSGMFFWALFKKQDGTVQRLSADCATSAGQLRDRLSRLRSETSNFALAVSREDCRFLLNDGLKLRTSNLKFQVPNASECAALGLRAMKKGKTETAYSFSPNYVRKNLYS